LTGEPCPPSGRCLTQDERRRILNRLHAALAWVGVRIPKEATLGGEKVELKDLVDRFVFDDFLDDGEREEVRRLIDRIEDQADFLEDELEERALSREQAEAILRQAIGLLRAVDELEHLDDVDGAIWEDRRRAVMEEVDDAQRWQEFTKRIYKKDEYY
jgi:hypothetical protein